jgi:hypothetical protein
MLTLAALHCAAGIGGGDQYGGVETNVTASAAAPYMGVWSQYAKSLDPWLNTDMSAYRKHYYGQYLKWLAKGTGPHFHVSKVFLYSGGSWDVAGVRYDSTTKDGSFSDAELAAAIAAHNAAANKA